MRLLVFVLAFGAARAAIEGTVFNGTTGKPQANVEVTLVRLEQGMTPVGTARSDAAGKFRFAQAVSGEMMLRAEYGGVSYNQRIPSGARASDVSVTVYAAVEATDAAGAPEQHVLLLEPSGAEMIVNESFLYRNDSRPPVTYVASKHGTLRFYLPPAARGVVEASGVGPAGMPLRLTPGKTAQPDIWEIGFPIKPGENRIDLNYRVPYKPPMEFDVRTLYAGAKTRVAAPGGATIAGEGLQPMGQEPQTQASIFELPAGPLARLTITGAGKLSRRETDEAAGDQQVSVVPPAVHQRMWWILALAAAILAVGFYALYNVKA